MYRTQVRVRVTNQVQMLLTEAVAKSGVDRSTYLQRVVVGAIQRDLGIDASDLMLPPQPNSSIARSSYGGLRTRYTAKQPTISFMAMGRVPSLLAEASNSVGMGYTYAGYVRRELRRALSQDLDIPESEIEMPRAHAELTDHPVFGKVPQKFTRIEPKPPRVDKKPRRPRKPRVW